MGRDPVLSLPHLNIQRQSRGREDREREASRVGRKPGGCGVWEVETLKHFKVMMMMMMMMVMILLFSSD